MSTIGEVAECTTAASTARAGPSGFRTPAAIIDMGGLRP
jgi:hypothetical protein